LLHVLGRTPRQGGLERLGRQLLAQLGQQRLGVYRFSSRSAGWASISPSSSAARPDRSARASRVATPISASRTTSGRPIANPSDMASRKASMDAHARLQAQAVFLLQLGVEFTLPLAHRHRGADGVLGVVLVSGG
jgi:hypothetical protein